MAKSNPLKTNVTTTLGDAVVRGEANQATLGGAASDVLDAATDALKVLVVAVGTNRAIIAQPAATALTGTALGTIVRDDPTKKSAPWTLTPVSGKEADPFVVAIQAALAAAKPKRALSSLISAIEDSSTGSDGSSLVGDGWYALVDQTGDGSVQIFNSDSAVGVSDFRTAALADIEQELDASASTAPTLPFE